MKQKNSGVLNPLNFDPKILYLQKSREEVYSDWPV